MAAPVGETIGLRGSGSRVPEICPTDTFDFGQMQEQLAFPDMAVPRWFGHGLSLPLVSGVGLGSTETLYGQSTLRPPPLHPTRRITTDFNLETDLAPEGTQRCTPRKRALFGRAYGGNRSPTVDLTEAQAGQSVDDISPEWDHLAGVELMDTVARLQMEVEELRSDPLFNRTGVAQCRQRRPLQSLQSSNSGYND